jgi:tetratricopeptide (TPR) repeat protein
MKRKYIYIAIITLPVLALLLYQLPPIKSRLEWRIAAWTANFQRWLNPPEEAIFVPGGDSPAGGSDPAGTDVAQSVTATLEALSYTPAATLTATPGATSTPTITPSPTITPTPIPASVLLTGFRHEYETWNNCGPATLGMQLSYWGWQGNQTITAAFLKPNPRDKNVSPTELAAYVETQTEYRAVYRVGGTTELLKQLIAAGFPTIVEKTLDLAGVDGWIGHYALVSGYDDGRARFTTQDSYIQPDFPEPYDKLQTAWRSFNFTFVTTYPPERAAELFAILGELADPARAHEIALERAAAEAAALTGLEQFFAQFNMGSSLAGLGRYAEAATAFDAAFALYAGLAPEERPWRMNWYQHGAYQSYYEMGRYDDVINLADTTLSTMGEQTIEETFYWRGLARAALGDVSGAIADLEEAVRLNANYAAASEALAQLQGN